MTLEEATTRAVADAKAGDLDALEQALSARAKAIKSGAIPTREALEAGEHALRLLKSMIARMTNLRAAIWRQDATSRIDYRL